MRASICAFADQKCIVLFRKKGIVGAESLHIQKKKENSKVCSIHIQEREKKKGIVQWDDDVAQHMYNRYVCCVCVCVCVCVYMSVFVWQSCSLGIIERHKT